MLTTNIEEALQQVVVEGFEGEFVSLKGDGAHADIFFLFVLFFVCPFIIGCVS